MSTEAQQDLMKSLASDWNKLLKSDLPSGNARIQKSSITEAMVIAKIDSDTGNRVLKKAKDIVAHIVNHFQL